MKEKIKELRLEIDHLVQLTKELKPININKELSGFGNYINSEEIKDCIKDLYYAKAWLGKILGELGENSPYKNDGNRKEVSDIETSSDTYKSNGEVKTICDEQDWQLLNYIEKVDWLRQEIEKVNSNFQNFVLDDINSPSKSIVLCGNVYTHLSEARFALGFEMQRIKEENDNNRK